MEARREAKTRIRDLLLQPFPSISSMFFVRHRTDRFDLFDRIRERRKRKKDSRCYVSCVELGSPLGEEEFMADDDGDGRVSSIKLNGTNYV